VPSCSHAAPDDGHYQQTNGKDKLMRQPLDNASYESIADFLSAMKAPPLNPANKKEWLAMGFDRRNDNWFGAGCRSGTDVQTLVSEGWGEGRERLNKFRGEMGALNAAPVDRRRRMIRAAMGANVDMQRVWTGQLETAWTLHKRQFTAGPQQIELCANMICIGAEHPDVLFWRGAAAAVLTDALEAAGYMVKLTVVFGGRHYVENSKVSCRITVKDHGAPFDIASTSATILPGFFRAIGHAWIAGHCKKDISSAGISVTQGRVEDHELLLSHDIRDHGTALAFVNDTIEKINNGTLAAA
jgi:hypothetical protein